MFPIGHELCWKKKKGRPCVKKEQKKKMLNKRRKITGTKRFHDSVMETFSFPHKINKEYFLEDNKEEELKSYLFKNKQNRNKLKTFRDLLYDKVNPEEESLETIADGIVKRFYGLPSDTSQRAVEKEDLNQQVCDTNNIFITFSGTIMPSHVITEILSFIKSDESKLFTIGLVCYNLYLLVINSWQHIFVTKTNLMKIPLPILQSVQEITIELGLNKENFEYLLSYIDTNKIRSLSFTNTIGHRYHIIPALLKRVDLGYESDLRSYSFFYELIQNRVFLNVKILKLPLVDPYTYGHLCNAFGLPTECIYSQSLYDSIKGIKIEKYFPNVREITDMDRSFNLNNLEKLEKCTLHNKNLDLEELKNIAFIPMNIRFLELINFCLPLVILITEITKNIESLVVKFDTLYSLNWYKDVNQTSFQFLELNCPMLKNLELKAWENESNFLGWGSHKIVLPSSMSQITFSMINNVDMWFELLNCYRHLERLNLGGYFNHFSIHEISQIIDLYFERRHQIPTISIKFMLERYHKNYMELKILCQRAKKLTVFINKINPDWDKYQLAVEEEKAIQYIFDAVLSTLETFDVIVIHSSEDFVILEDFEESLKKEKKRFQITEFI